MPTFRRDKNSDDYYYLIEEIMGWGGGEINKKTTIAFK